MILDFDPPISVVRELFLEYAEQLGVDLCFQNFQQEVANLPDKYTALIVAFEDEVAVGCVALRSLNGRAPEMRTAEMKRLYLRQEYRGKGRGRLLAAAAVAKARELGYNWLRLDTLPSMESAMGLYRSLGFCQVPAYDKHAELGLLYFELSLSSMKASGSLV